MLLGHCCHHCPLHPSLLLLLVPRWPSPVPEPPAHRVPQLPEDQCAGEWWLSTLLSPGVAGPAPGMSVFATRPLPCSRSQPLTSRLLCCSTPASSTTATKSFPHGWGCWHRNTGARQCLSPAKGTREGKLGLCVAAGVAACFLLPCHALAGCLGTQHLLCPLHSLWDGEGGTESGRWLGGPCEPAPCQAAPQ